MRHARRFSMSLEPDAWTAARVVQQVPGLSAMRRTAWLLTVLLAACGASDFGTRLPAAPLQLPDLPAATPDAQDVALWLVPGAPRDGRVLELRQLAGCPQLQVLARVTRLPALDDPSLRPEPAVRLTSDGVVEQTWRLPANAVIVGRQGNTLLVAQPLRNGRVETLAIQPSGSMSLAGALDPARAARLVEPATCPTQIGMPAGLEARSPRCWQVRETPQGSPWLLMQPRACAG